MSEVKSFIPSGLLLTQTICLLVDYVVKELPFMLKWFPVILTGFGFLISLVVLLFGILLTTLLDR